MRIFHILIMSIPSGRLTKPLGELGKSGRKLGKAVEGLVEGCTTEKGQVTK